MDDITIIYAGEVTGIAEYLRLSTQVLHGVMLFKQREDMRGELAPVHHSSPHYPGCEIVAVSGKGVGDRAEQKFFSLGNPPLAGNHRTEISHPLHLKHGIADGLAFCHMGGAVDGFPNDAGTNQNLQASAQRYVRL